MSNILVFIPKEFNCYSKIHRKLTRITSAFTQFKIICPFDENSLLERFTSENTNCDGLTINRNWSSLEYTHAVVFDDHETFTKEIEFLKTNNIPLRIIPIEITRVINIHHHPEYQNIKKTQDYEYIGRGSVWGNPYAMHGAEMETREDVISKFQYDFDKDILMKVKKTDASKLIGKKLGCFCKPLACHGDVIANYLNSLDDDN